MSGCQNRRASREALILPAGRSRRAPKRPAGSPSRPTPDQILPNSVQVYPASARSGQNLAELGRSLCFDSVSGPPISGRFLPNLARARPNLGNVTRVSPNLGRTRSNLITVGSSFARTRSDSSWVRQSLSFSRPTLDNGLCQAWAVFDQIWQDLAKFTRFRPN